MRYLKIVFLCCCAGLVSCGGGSSSSGGTTMAENSNPSSGNAMPIVGSNSSDVFQGIFVSSAHPTSGQAIIGDGVLTLRDFQTDSGPKLLVYLSTSSSPSQIVDLGELKSVNGTSEYALPDGLNYNEHKFVIIWCIDFSVNFGYAELRPS